MRTLFSWSHSFLKNPAFLGGVSALGPKLQQVRGEGAAGRAGGVGGGGKAWLSPLVCITR
jgi:hypothetical protein